MEWNSDENEDMDMRYSGEEIVDETQEEIEEESKEETIEKERIGLINDAEVWVNKNRYTEIMEVDLYIKKL